MKMLKKDKLVAYICDTRAEMGAAAGTLAAKRIREALAAKDYPLASRLQEEMHEKVEELIFAYNEYKKNIL